MISTNTYLNFSGNCEEAFQFYEKTLGGKVIMTHRMSEMPMPCPEGKEKQIAHIRMGIGDDILMGSDSPSQHESKPSKPRKPWEWAKDSAALKEAKAALAA